MKKPMNKFEMYANKKEMMMHEKGEGKKMHMMEKKMGMKDKVMPKKKK